MTKESGKRDRRITCKTCNTPDVYNYAKGNCRSCHFALKEGRQIAVKKQKAKAGTVGECEICHRTIKIATSDRCWKCYKKHGLDPVAPEEIPGPPNESAPETRIENRVQSEETARPQMLYSMAFLEGKKSELERLESSAAHQEKLLDVMKLKISILRPLIEDLSLAIEYDKTGASF